MELHPPKGKRGKQGSQMAFTGRKAFLDGYSDGPPSGEDMSFEWPAWAEEGITRLGQYYGVPAISLRDALFHELKSQDARFPVKQVFHDRHHPGAWGHSLLAQMAVGLLSSAATEVTALGAARAQEEGASFGTAAAVRDRLCGRAQGEARLRQLRLTAPIYSETPEAAVGTCVKGEQVTELVS